MSPLEEKFVTRVEMAAMQIVILGKAKELGTVTKDNLQQIFRPGGQLQMSTDHLQHCLEVLVNEGHLQDAGNNQYKITDDGREDLQQIQHLLVQVPQVVGVAGAAGQPRAGQPGAPTGAGQGRQATQMGAGGSPPGQTGQGRQGGQSGGQPGRR